MIIRLSNDLALYLNDKRKQLKMSQSKVLVVERFHRKWSRDHNYIFRMPQEDMCQSLGYSPNLKYQSDGGPGIKEIMQLLNGSNQPQKDRDAFFKCTSR